jgi:flap endonuclease-1
MGIYGMSRYIRQNMENNKCVKYNTLSCYKYNRIAFDYYNLLHKFLQRSSNDDDYLMEFINLIHKFSKYNVDMIFVIDGKPLKEKEETLNERKTNNKRIIQTIKEEIKNEVDAKIRDEKVQKLKKVNYSISPNHIIKSKELFDTLGIRYLHFENFEADMIFKYLSDSKIIDACYSNDMDLLTFGCKKVLNDLDFINDVIVEHNYDEIIKKLEMTPDEFIDLCICCGTDYNNSLNNSNFEKNISLIKKYKNIENIIDSLNNELNNDISIPSRFDYKKVRKIYNFELPQNDCKTIISGFRDEIINKNTMSITLKKLIEKLIKNKKQPKYVYKVKEFAYYKYEVNI